MSPDSLPSSVYSMLGPVPVILVDNLIDTDGEVLLGRWCPEERCIKLRSSVHPITQRATLMHESIHLWMWDAGVGLDAFAEERVCDALGTAMLAAQMADRRA